MGSMINQLSCLGFALCVYMFISTFFINEILSTPTQDLGVWRILFGIAGGLLFFNMLITLPNK